MLFTRHISGARVVTCTANTSVAQYQFTGYGSHLDNYPTQYLTCAAAIGQTKYVPIVVSMHRLPTQYNTL